MQYFVTSLIWLSLETYYNQGMTSDQARSLIENLNDPYGPNAKLYCARAGYNGNWKVETSALHQSRLPTWWTGFIEHLNWICATNAQPNQ
jgi:hypothetical protein